MLSVFCGFESEALLSSIVIVGLGITSGVATVEFSAVKESSEYIAIANSHVSYTVEPL